ncbi:MAG: hypothetical protein PWR10_1564 [Halanaerobiales bacterium]|nr:hypothetical protein [Halanaerobiales bacterium]
MNDVKERVKENLKESYPGLSEETLHRIAEEAAQIYEERQMEDLKRSVAATD